METEPISPSMPDRMELLRRRAACPRCGKVMQWRALAYKHMCNRPCTPEEVAAAERKRLEALTIRATAIMKRRMTAKGLKPSRA